MLPLFSADGRKAMADLPQKKTLLAFDFDGTLAPLVSQPQDAYTYDFLLPALHQLEKKKRLAVISGRAVKDVRKRLLFKPDFVVGNHGLEGLTEFADQAKQANQICRRWVQQLKKALGDLPGEHGIFVEDKKHSLSLHYRHAKDPIRTAKWLTQQIELLSPAPRVIGGKVIFNLVPVGSPHKGKAMKALMKRLGYTHALFVGDDVTDEDAFKEKGKILSVRVGKSRESHARFFLRNPNEILELLNQLTKHFTSV